MAGVADRPPRPPRGPERPGSSSLGTSRDLEGRRRAAPERRTRWRDARGSARPWVSPELPAALAATGPPAGYLHVAAWAPAIPVYPGTRLSQPVPFQWSLDRVDAAGEWAHREFLAEATAADPRPALAAALLDAVRIDAAPILVWGGYEARMLAELAEAVPSLAIALADTRERLVDLHALACRHVDLPGFAGSDSVRAVAPALAPGTSGAGWEKGGAVADSASAGAAFGRLVAGEVAEPEARALRDALRSDCARDTRALVEVHRALRELAKGR